MAEHPDKCPECGAGVWDTATRNRKGMRPRGEDTSDIQVYHCGSYFSGGSLGVTQDCCERQIAKLRTTLRRLAVAVDPNTDPADFKQLLHEAYQLTEAT